MEWKLADAKNRLSELVTKATTEGPQTIRRLNDTVIVIAEADYRALTGEKLTLGQYLARAPKADLKLKRKKSAMRDGLHLMTRNTKDFVHTDVLLINPWEE